MTTLRKSFIIGLAVLGMGGTTLAVQAQSGAAPAARPGANMSHAQMQATWSERRAERQQQLHDALKLTSAQDAAWITWIGSARRTEHGERMGRGSMASMPAPQRMEQHIAMAKQRLAHMETALAALNTFYAVLTPEQKKVFDERAMHEGRPGGRHQMGEGMGHKAGA